MILDITGLDQSKIVQAIFINANSPGFGSYQNAISKANQKMEGYALDLDQCLALLDSGKKRSYRTSGEYHYFIDYVEGKRIKYSTDVVNGRRLMYTELFDQGQAKYAALIIMMKTFYLNQFSIAQKSYYSQRYVKWNKLPESNPQLEKNIEKLIASTIKVKESYGRRWYFPDELVSKQVISDYNSIFDF